MDHMGIDFGPCMNRPHFACFTSFFVGSRQPTIRAAGYPMQISGWRRNFIRFALGTIDEPLNSQCLGNLQKKTGRIGKVTPWLHD